MTKSKTQLTARQKVATIERILGQMGLVDELTDVVGVALDAEDFAEASAAAQKLAHGWQRVAEACKVSD